MKKILSYLFGILILLNAAGCKRLSLKHQNLDNEYRNWTLYGGEAERANYREESLSPPLKNVWIHKTTSAIGQSVLVINGVIYAPTLDGRIYAVDIKTGEKFARAKGKDGHELTCAYYDPYLIVAARYGDETLGNYSLEKQKYLWKIDAGHIAGEPVVQADGIYVAALYKHIDKYQLDTGDRIWSFKTGGQIHSSPAVADNVLVVGCDDGILYALSTKTGKLKWKYETGASILASPTISGETVFIGSTDSTFYALALHTGEVLWKWQTGRPVYQMAATDGEHVAVGLSDGRLLCFNAANGHKRWDYMAKSVISTAPVIAGEVIYFGSLDSHYYALNLADGKELWSFATKGRIRTSPVVWGKYLIGASEDKYLYAFTLSDSVSVQ